MFATNTSSFMLMVKLRKLVFSLDHVLDQIAVARAGCNFVSNNMTFQTPQTPKAECPGGS